MAVNQAWKRFAKNNGGSPDGYIGANYLATCRKAAADGAVEAKLVVKGLRALLNGTAPSFQFEYPCHSPTVQRWFVMHASPLKGGWTMLRHSNITERKRTEQSLETSEHNLKVIFDNTDMAFYLVDRDGKIEFFNKAALIMNRRLQGKEVEVGQSFLELVPPQLQDAFTARFQRALAGETVQHEVFTLESWFEASYRPVLEGDVVTGICLGYRDISERKQAEYALRSSEEQLTRIFHHSPAATFIVALKDHLVVDANNTFLNLVGAKRSAVIGKTVPKLRLLQNPKILSLERSDEAPTFETRLRTADGIWRTVIMETVEVEYMKLPCLLVTCIDISERKRTEEQLLRAVQEVMKDTEWFGRSLLEQLAKIRHAVPQSDTVNLTKREREVLSLMAVGQANEDIAEKLAISHQTVRNYVTRIYDKLGVHSRAEAVVWARQHGFGSA